MKSMERPGESISRSMSVATNLSTFILALRQVTPRRRAADRTNMPRTTRGRLDAALLPGQSLPGYPSRVSRIASTTLSLFG